MLLFFLVSISINTTRAEFSLGVYIPTIWWAIKVDESSVLPLQERIKVGPLSEAIITFGKSICLLNNLVIGDIIVLSALSRAHGWIGSGDMKSSMESGII